MEWRLDSGAPIYYQLVEKLRLDIASGKLAPGEKIPPVRELAAEAGVNPNTMQRALAALEAQGLVYSQRTAGRFVTEDVKMIDEARKSIAAKNMGDFISSMEQLGCSRSEMLEMLKNEMEERNDAGNGM